MTSIVAILISVLPLNEARMIERIALKYELSEHETVLLAAIRKVENGGPGLEFGVGTDEPGHKARRYAFRPAKSFLIQGQWAAGTIKKRYTGDLRAFSRRYCPKNARKWRKNVESWMARINGGRKAGRNDTGRHP